MGKRKRGRCVKNNTNVNTEPGDVVQAPHSFVIHKGLPGGHLLELTKDFRKVMEPFTATALKERKRNAIKDFVAVAGPLHVSHLAVFSRTEVGMYFKVCRLPRGPTMTFKVHNFSLARDVVSSLKQQNVVEAAFKHSPLIVLNSFSSEGMHMKLMASMFQNMFPAINLTNVDLNTVRRCVLLNYNPASKLIDFRHYTIKVNPVGISKGVKKVVQGKVPNLNHCSDISEFLTKSGMLSESEAEDDPNNHVTLSQKIISRGNMQSGKSSIKLSELGPRLSLQLLKIEDGLLDGEVLYHDLIEKTDEEKLEIQKKRDSKKKLKEKRKKNQEKNKEMKEQAKQELKEKSLQGMKKKQIDSQELSNEQNKSTPVPDDDAEYYREEVGEEPEKGLFTSKPTGFRKTAMTHLPRKRKLNEKTENRDVKRFKKSNMTERDKGTNKKGKINLKRDKRTNKKSKINFSNRDKRQIGGKFINKNFNSKKMKNKGKFKK